MEPSSLEFRATVDDAWYDVRLYLLKDSLTVKFIHFSDAYNETFTSNCFITLQELHHFAKRFRPHSVQLQDPDCSKVVEGITVCASCFPKNDDLRFFDAVVDSVKREKHSFSNEEEKCQCTFGLHWQHGENVGAITSASIENLCLIVPNTQIDPKVATFLRISKQKIERTMPNPSSIESEGLLFGISNSNSIERKTTDQDTDLGGGIWSMNIIHENQGHHFILVEALEKDLRPSTIVEFIQKQTSILSKAYVYPSLLSESYTRGIIVVNCKEKLKKIYKFLDNPDHIIISYRGRPWVITETKFRRGIIESTIGGFMSKSSNRIAGTCGELKVIYSGTEEYRMAKCLQNLYTDFANHQRRLHQKLDLEEKRILRRNID